MCKCICRKFNFIYIFLKKLLPTKLHNSKKKILKLKINITNQNYIIQTTFSSVVLLEGD